MKRESEEISSEGVQNEIRQLQLLENRLSWTRILTQIGGTVCSFWLIYRVFTVHGFLPAFLAFLGLSIVYKFGVSPMFAVAASVLCFRYNAVGIWLPIISYFLAVVLLYIDLKRDNLRLRVDPYNLGSVHD